MERAIEIEDLAVRFPARGGMVDALTGLSLTVSQGQVVGFLGPNGAGKTTTMHVLLGFIRASSGTARIFGRDVTSSIARERIGYLPEQPETYKFMTGRELLTMAGRLFLIKKKPLVERVAELLLLVDMEDAADRRIATYSRGMMQRISLAQALVNNPDLVILDEPTGGLDPLGRMAIRRIIGDLRKDGKAVFFSSHELSEVELVCDHIAILARGKLVAEGAASELVAQGESLEQYFLKTVASTAETTAPAGHTP